MQKLAVLIDDNRLNNFINRILIQQFDSSIKILEFESACNAIKKLSEISESLPDCEPVIFLDINMPGMDGFSFLEEFRESGLCAHQIVMLSSTINQEEIERARAHPMVSCFISKPLTLEILPSLFLMSENH
jgi:CheY-like chemotaxis protein